MNNIHNQSHCERWSISYWLRVNKMPAFAACLFTAVVLTGGGRAQLFSNSSSVSKAEMDVAVSKTVSLILTNAACPSTPDGIEVEVAGLFPIINPELANRD